MKRILFVDDELGVLEALARMLYPLRAEWEMAFVPSGEAALAELERAPFDVIVSDMRMPGMDGAALLGRVEKRFPEIVRIVLSGYSEVEAALRVVPVAHQFLAKPCEAEKLREVVARSCALQALLSEELLRAAVAGIGALPSVPQVYAELTRALADENTPVADVARIVERDIALCAKLLQLVNSAFFGLPRRVTSIRSAVAYLGTNLLKNLALSLGVFRAFEGANLRAGFSLEAEQRHALLVASTARRMLDDPRQAEDAFCAGMLHDIGRLVLAANLPEQFSRVLDAMRREGAPAPQVEAKLLGASHAEIGAYLLGIWGLPYPVVEAVAHHHRIERVEQRSFDATGAVYVANLLAREEEGALQTGGAAVENVDVRAYLEGLGVAERLGEWRAVAAGQARGMMEGLADGI